MMKYAFKVRWSRSGWQARPQRNRIAPTARLMFSAIWMQAEISTSGLNRLMSPVCVWMAMRMILKISKSIITATHLKFGRIAGPWAGSAVGDVWM